MIDNSNDTTSLADFKENTSEYIETLKRTGRPEVLTVNGNPELVVLNLDAYRKLLAKADANDAISGMREGIAAHARGEGFPMRESVQRIADKHGIRLEK